MWCPILQILRYLLLYLPAEMSGEWEGMSAGGENGFNQAIELSADTLANVKFVQEKRLISK